MKVVTNKSDKELLSIAEHATDYQDEFLLVLKEELDKRGLECNSAQLKERLSRIAKIETAKVNQKHLLNRLPTTMVWAANFIYISIGLNFLLLMKQLMHVQVGGTSVTWLFPLLGFSLMIFVAAVIKKGQNVTKVMIIVVVFSAFNLLIKGSLYLQVGDHLAAMLLFLITGFEVVALILLYNPDSRDWYANEGKHF